MTTDSSSFVMPTSEPVLLDYTDIDQGLNLWSEILPLIDKEILTLTTVAQEMQECPDRHKYVDVLMKIAVRVNDVEEKATTCIKVARTQLKKTNLINKENDRDESEEEEEEMDIDQSQTNEQIEVSALNADVVEKVQNQMHKVLIKPSDPNTFNIDADDRYADFAECISKMQNDQNNGEDDSIDVVDQVVSNICPLTQAEFVEAVQNKKCKHKYEKKVVLKYISDKNKSSRRPVKCPAAGCDQILQEKDLINA